MVKHLLLALLVLSTVTPYAESKSVTGSLWTELDINDPALSKGAAMRQCEKSLKYAVNELESWCEKAYQLGAWEALLYIGYHTGDGSRYVHEVKQRAANDEIKAIRKLAWLYDGGLFIENNPTEAARLYELFLTKATDASPRLLRRIHYDLAKIYTKLEDWPSVINHAEYVLEHSEGDGTEALARELRDYAKTQTSQ